MSRAGAHKTAAGPSPLPVSNRKGRTNLANSGDKGYTRLKVYWVFLETHSARPGTRRAPFDRLRMSGIRLTGVLRQAQDEREYD